MSKITLGEASRVAGVHFNTLRNWRKTGKLKSAEKVIENGRELWLVDLEEVESLAGQSRQSVPTSQENQGVDIGHNNSTSQPVAAPGQGFEQSLLFMRESVVRPLVEANERKDKQLREMAEEIGTLKERLRVLEAAHVARTGQEADKPAGPVDITPKAESGPGPAKKRRWWRF